MMVNLTLRWLIRTNQSTVMVGKFCPLCNIIRIVPYLISGDAAESKSSALSVKKRHLLLGENTSEKKKNSWLDGPDGSSIDMAEQMLKATLTKRQKACESCSSFWGSLLHFFICL